MRLNPDCIRDILLEVEKNSTLDFGLHIDTDDGNPLFDKYSWTEIVYHIGQCERAGLLRGAMIFECDGYADVYDLTPSGHEFLANIRQDTTWNKTKEIAKKVGSFSLSALKDIASNVVSNIIASQFNSPIK